MIRNRWYKWTGLAGLGLILLAGAAPAAQALAVTAFVAKQSCVNGDIVAVTLSASVQPKQAVKYRWDFNNDGVFDTAASSTPTVTHRYSDERRVTARVMAISGSAPGPWTRSPSTRSAAAEAVRRLLRLARE
jgi:uncharacterized protein (DUF58 family)